MAPGEHGPEDCPADSARQPEKPCNCVNCQQKARAAQIQAAVGALAQTVGAVASSCQETFVTCKWLDQKVAGIQRGQEALEGKLDEVILLLQNLACRTDSGGRHDA